MTSVTERSLEQPWVYKAWQAPFAEQKFVVRRLIASGAIQRADPEGWHRGAEMAKRQSADG